MKQEFTKYERARILGARALQISMDAPMLMKVDEKELDAVNYDPLRLAEKELDSGVLPIEINRPMPEMTKEKLHELTAEEIEKEKQKAEAAEKVVVGTEADVANPEVKKEMEEQDTVDMKSDEELEEEAEEADDNPLSSGEEED